MNHIRLAHGVKCTEVVIVKEVKSEVKSAVNSVTTDDGVVGVNTIVKCYKCHAQVKANMPYATLYRVASNVVCDHCIASFYSREDILYAIRASKYDSTGTPLTVRCGAGRF